jgi:D-inositol-3-phosphate glycosyltransferase
MSPRRTLLVGQLAQPTGMARVLREVARGLGERRIVHVLGTDVRCFDPASAPWAVGFQVHSNPVDYDPFAELALAALCADVSFDSIVLYQDPWFIPRLHGAAAKGGVPIGAYCPIDGPCLRPDVIGDLAALDGIAVPTSFARNVVRQCAEQVSVLDAPAFRDISVLPHGVDTSAFYPLGGDDEDIATRRARARRAIFPSRSDLWEGFLVFNGNRNQPRKRLDLTLQGFAKFAADKPSDVRLCLHWGAERAAVDLASLARELGIADRIVVPTHREGIGVDELNLLYNACDVGVNTALGEGWGLVSFEHGATGAAQIVPDHSGCGELWRTSGVLLPVRRSVTLAGWVEGGEIAPDDLASALERLYVDHTWREKMASAARSAALSKAYEWRSIAEAWDCWLSKLETHDASLPLEDSAP